MRILAWIMAAMVGLANAAQAQLRLPGVQLPALSIQSQTVGQTGVGPLEQLSDVRHAQIARLLRVNPRTIAADQRGEPIVRDELLAVTPSEAALTAARALGFLILREEAIAGLEVRVTVLKPPRNAAIAQALRELREADQGGTYDYNHIYTGGGSVSTAALPDGASRETPDAADSGPRERYRIGLIDTGIDMTHPVFHDAVIHPWGCHNQVMPSAHGTAVASLLLGQAGDFRGVLSQAELYAADVYCNAPTGGAVDALASAFAWLAEQRVAVINVSLVGPDNAVLAQIVRSLTARGYLLVAAVGNDGPSAPPLYPASYPGVVGVTAVDAHRRVLLEAARGQQVMFAAPGADMAAAAPAGIFVGVRGTSFAAPLVAALLAQSVAAPDATRAAAAVEALAQQAIDLGPPGRDLTYGFGLVGTAAPVDPASVRHK